MVAASMPAWYVADGEVLERRGERDDGEVTGEPLTPTATVDARPASG